MLVVMHQRVVKMVAQCAHCGRVFEGDSQAQTWEAAKACASSHQCKSYRYAPELRPSGAACATFPAIPRTPLPPPHLNLRD
jgi:hypothetical protein